MPPRRTPRLHETLTAPVAGPRLPASCASPSHENRGAQNGAIATAQFPALAVLITSRYAPGTSRLGVVPTGESLDVLRLLVTDGLDQFRELRAPVESLDPFIAAAMPCSRTPK